METVSIVVVVVVVRVGVVVRVSVVVVVLKYFRYFVFKNVSQYPKQNENLNETKEGNINQRK